MIFGSYPCCDAVLTLAMPDQTPVFNRDTCPECGATIWHLLSRVECMSWTEADFLAEYDVREETKRITKKV